MHRLALARDRHRHALAGRVKVADVKDAGRLAKVSHALDQGGDGRDAQLTQAGPQTCAVPLAQWDQHAFHGGLVHPQL